MTIQRTLRLPLLLLLFIAGVVSQNSFAKSFFWQVQSPTTTFYLLGSIHVATTDFYPLTAEIENAFEKSPILVLEINKNIIDPNVMQAEMAKISLYPGNETIKDHLDGETLNMLTSYMSKNGFPVEPFIKLKPSMLVMTLSMAKLNSMGYQAKYGIDEYFLTKATGNKTILELEDYKVQLDLLASLPNDAWYVRYALEQMETIESQVQAMASAWKRGDVEKMEKIILIDVKKDFPNIEAVYEKMFYQRNLKMTNKIIGYLAQKKTHFVIVGAGHLVASANQSESELQNSETFLLSNMSPQTPQFNRCLWKRLEAAGSGWKRLEAAVRELDSRDKIYETYVICGPIFDFDTPVARIGTTDSNGVSLPVPNAYFKSVLTENHKGTLHMWSFIMPNADSDQPLKDFLVPTAVVERMSGILLWDRLMGKKIQREKNRIRKMW